MAISRSPAEKRYRERASRAPAHHRLAQPEVARWYLLQAMVSNIDLPPRIVGLWDSEAGVRLKEGDLHCFRRLEEVRKPQARGEVPAEWQALIDAVLGQRPAAL